MVDDRAVRALATFRGGFNCAQAVFSAFAPALGLEREAALRIAGAFGGGMGQAGGTCGAVTGALMVLGLAYGKDHEDDGEAKDRCYRHANELLARFAEEHRTCLCRELIRYDLRDPEEHQAAKAAGVFEDLCTGFVRTAALNLGTILEEDPSPRMGGGE